MTVGNYGQATNVSLDGGDRISAMAGGADFIDNQNTGHGGDGFSGGGGYCQGYEVDCQIRYDLCCQKRRKVCKYQISRASPGLKSSPKIGIGMYHIPWVAHDIRKVFEKVSKNISNIQKSKIIITFTVTEGNSQNIITATLGNNQSKRSNIFLSINESKQPITS